MLTPIEDLGFSHDVEQDDGERDGFETVHAKITAQWYVDPDDPKSGWNVERPGYVLREREMFLDGVCFVKMRRDGGEWLINIYGPEFNYEGDWPPGDYFLYVNKYTTDGKPWYNKSWNANYEGEAAYGSAQWNLGEDFQFDGEEDLSSFTLSNDLVKLEVKPIQQKNLKLNPNETLSTTNHLRLARIGLRIGAGRTIEYKT